MNIPQVAPASNSWRLGRDKRSFLRSTKTDYAIGKTSNQSWQKTESVCPQRPGAIYKAAMIPILAAGTSSVRANSADLRSPISSIFHASFENRIDIKGKSLAAADR
ncbi:hypothetical protein NDA07_17880 [Microcoleus vaginatus DQ-U2]|uniref:hypothetical protein n=1 Tax=Microcoleus vaginatus TaxID=119532 RepID=UPI0032A40D58